MNTQHTWANTPAQFTGELTLTMYTHSNATHRHTPGMYTVCTFPPKHNA